MFVLLLLLLLFLGVGCFCLFFFFFFWTTGIVKRENPIRRWNDPLWWTQ